MSAYWEDPNFIAGCWAGEDDIGIKMATKFLVQRAKDEGYKKENVKFSKLYGGIIMKRKVENANY